MKIHCPHRKAKGQRKADGGSSSEDADNLLINVIEEGNSMLENLHILNLRPQVCLRERAPACQPLNLYHKVVTNTKVCN